MANYLITGSRNNTPHITSMDDASFNAGIVGNGAYILNRGEKLRAEMTTSNNCRIYDGDIVCQGRHSRIETSAYVDITINNGSAGLKRNDLIVARYAKDADTGVESVDFVVIEGTPSATPTDPEYNEGNIFDGDLIVDFPIYRIQLDGISVSNPVRLIDEAPTIADIQPVETNGIWTIERRSNGLCEMWGHRVVNGLSLTAKRGDWYTTTITAAQIPSGILTEVVYATSQVRSTEKLVNSQEFISSLISTGTITLYSPIEIPSTGVVVDYHILGRWR